MKRQIKHIKGLSKVLKSLAREVEEKGCFDKEDLELLKKVGTALLWKGATLDYMELGKKTPFSL
jgi:hypothetical protein